MKPLTPAELEELAIEIYAAMYEQYDKRAGKIAPRDAWKVISEEQKEMARDQARYAARWFARRSARK